MSQIKLNTYIIQVRTKNTGKRKNNKPQKNQYFKFSKVENSEGEIFDFIAVFKMFINEFNGSFLGLSSENKAMRLTKELNFNRKEETISGFFKAGFTGEEKEIFNKDNEHENSIFTVKSEHVNCSDYYFKLWMPSQGAIGLLLVQGTSVESAANLFKTLLHLYLTKKLAPNLVRIGRFIPVETIDNFRKKSKVKKVVLYKNSYSKDRANDILGQEVLQSNVRMKLIIEGEFLDGKIEKYVNNNMNVSIGNQPKFFTSEILEKLQFGESDEYYTDISFKDMINNKTAVARSKSGFELKPFTYIDETEIERDINTKKPTKQSLKLAIDKQFNIIKKEIR